MGAHLLLERRGLAGTWGRAAGAHSSGSLKRGSGAGGCSEPRPTPPCSPTPPTHQCPSWLALRLKNQMNFL